MTSAVGTDRTLGKHGQKNKSSVGAALSARAFGLFSCGSWLCIRWESAAPFGAQKCMSMINPGLAPWAMREYLPCRAYIAFRFVCPQGFILGFALIAPWAMQGCRPFRAISVSDTKPQSISMYQHIRTDECPTTAIQSDNNPSYHKPSANSFGFIHYMGMGEPFRATLLHSPGWRECRRHEQNPG